MEQGAFENSENSTEIAFNKLKRKKLVSKIKEMSYPVIPVQEFFDGNESDLGSIGCNLYPSHPGISVFRSAFESLLSRSDVSEIYVHISEIEPDEESWPFTDRVYIFGAISADELGRETKSIQPTEIGSSGSFFTRLPDEIAGLSSSPIQVLWWD